MIEDSGAALRKEKKRVIELLVSKFQLDRTALAKAIEKAGLAYDGQQALLPEFDDSAPDKLDELDRPISDLIGILSGHIKGEVVDKNVFRLAQALAGPKRRESWSQELSITAAWPTCEGEIAGELYRLIARLETIRSASAEIHVPPKRGKPRQNEDLRDAVSILASFWEGTGRTFTINWHLENGRYEPISDAAQFVYAVMTLITEKDRLSQLREVTRLQRKQNRKISPNRHK